MESRGCNNGFLAQVMLSTLIDFFPIVQITILSPILAILDDSSLPNPINKSFIQTHHP